MTSPVIVLVLVCFISLGLTDPVLKASPDILTATERSVTLTWSGVTAPTSYDFVAVYSPSNGSNTQEYMGWIFTSQSPTASQGYGSITLPYLVNMRTDYVFRLWVCGNTHNCSGSMSAVATSNAVVFDAPFAPSQGHLALTSQSDVLSFLWVSGDNASVPTVYYGLSSGDLQFEVTGTTTTYGRSLMCDSPANDSTVFKNPGFIHTAFLHSLQPSTQYFYKFGSEMSGWSEIFSFISPQPQVATEEVYIVAYGDMGVAVPFNINNDQQPPALQTAALVRELISTPGATSHFAKYSNKYQNSNTPLPWTLLHIGDISYARGYGFLWDYFFDLIQPIATQIPYMVCIGNHEFDYYGMPWRANDDYGNDSGGECGIPYNMRFLMPGTAPTNNLWYSFNQGPIHFVFMSSEHNFEYGSTQYNWILNDLKAVDREATPWIVFSGHRPAYTSSTLTSNETQWIQNIYEPLWIKFRVNMCLWGHVHVYERTCGVQNHTCIDNDAAPVHVVIGMAGNDYQVPWASPDLSKGGNGHAEQPAWSIFRTQNYGYSRFFANATHLNFQFVGDQRGEVHDDFWLTPY